MTDSVMQPSFWQTEQEAEEPPRRTIAQIQADGINSDTIKTLLRLRHSDAFQWAFFDEFIPGIGSSSFNGTRLDAWAMNVFPSSGYTTIAYEIKVSRGDFLRELKDPNKRQWAMTFTDEFYFVAPRHLISPKELPEGCGLVEVSRVEKQYGYEVNGQQYNIRARVKPLKSSDYTRWDRDRDRAERPTWALLAAVARRSCRAEKAVT